jgi:hypothetical protein
MPSSVLDQVVEAIAASRDHKGASRQAVVKYLKSAGLDNKTAIGKALKKGVESGVLVCEGGSRFFVAGASRPEVPADEIVETEVLSAGPSDAAVAAKGMTVDMSYKGTLDDGHQFDAAKTFTFTLGAGDVIKGWDRGIVGMRVGEKRRLVVPSKLGYGMKGSAPDIPPGATLHFVVTLKGIL